MALFVFTAMAAHAEDTAWRHYIGTRLGGVGVIPLAYSLSAFHEAQSNRNLSIRSALEFTNGKEFSIYGRADTNEIMNVSRIGAAVDFIYYTSSKRPIGTGFFVIAGMGAHRYDIKYNNDDNSDPCFPDESVSNGLMDRHTAASLSLGIGYQGKKIGVELKRYIRLDDSFPESIYEEGMLRSWFQSSIIFRFPMSGQQKAESVRKLNYRDKKSEVLESAPRHKIGLRLGITGYSIFYEHQFDKHWAIRPAIELTTGMESYDDIPYGSPRNVDVDRVGLLMDAIYHAHTLENGSKFYLLAGLGVHKINMKDAEFMIGADGVRYTEYSGLTPTLSVGLGYYFGRFFGLEYKHTFSALKSHFYDESVGRNWGQLTASFRIPLAGSPK